MRLRVRDVALNGVARHRAAMVQQKTSRPVQFKLTPQTRESPAARLARRGGAPDDHVFPGPSRLGAHLSTRQYARLVGEWVAAIGLSPAACGTHSLRRTQVALICKHTGNLRAVRMSPGHTKVESTVRYLGVGVEDALALFEATEI
jgi:site-specific recombinase XerC